MKLFKLFIVLLLLTSCFFRVSDDGLDRLEYEIAFCKLGYLIGLENVPNFSELPVKERVSIVAKAESTCASTVLEIRRKAKNETQGE